MKTLFKFALLFTLVALPFASCQDEVGTVPGTDKTPVITVKQYEVSENDTPENDIRLRVYSNAAVSDVRYLAQLKEEKEKLQLNDEDYAKYVAEHGTKIDVKPSSAYDLLIKGLRGEYVISVVSQRNGGWQLSSVPFSGYDYKTLGTYVFTGNNPIFKGGQDVQVEYSAIGNSYRVKDIWSEGSYLVFSPKADGSVDFSAAQFSTGVEHPTYKLISAVPVVGKSTYDEATKSFTLVLDYRVAAGSFGVKVEKLAPKN